LDFATPKIFLAKDKKRKTSLANISRVSPPLIVAICFTYSTYQSQLGMLGPRSMLLVAPKRLTLAVSSLLMAGLLVFVCVELLLPFIPPNSMPAVNWGKEGPQSTQPLKEYALKSEDLALFADPGQICLEGFDFTDCWPKAISGGVINPEEYGNPSYSRYGRCPRYEKCYRMTYKFTAWYESPLTSMCPYISTVCVGAGYDEGFCCARCYDEPHC
jgi:hypothetical protein